MLVQADQEAGDGMLPTQPPVACRLGSGDVLPPFQVQALDRWGNKTGPSQDLPFSLLLECEGLQGSPVTAAFDDAGIAKLQGESAAESARRSSLACFSSGLSTLSTTAFQEQH